MKHRLRRLLASSALALVAACATTSGTSGGDDEVHEGWVMAAWHWVFPPTLPSAPPPPPPPPAPPLPHKVIDPPDRASGPEDPVWYRDRAESGDFDGDDVLGNGPGWADGLPRDEETRASLMEALRSYGFEVSDDATMDELWSIYEFSLIDVTATAAGGGSIASACEAEVDGLNPIRLTCQERDPSGAPGDLKTARVPIRGTVIETLNKLAIQLAGGEQQLMVGNPDTQLCVWNQDETLDLTDNDYFYECLDFDLPLSRQVDAGAVGFDSGRIAHQAPKEMVVDQPYILEIAIQPLTRDMTVEAADETLRNTLGTGLVPGSTETPFDIQFDTVRASKVMSADLDGDGFDIKAMTPKEQAVMPDAPTVWQWRVIPKEDGFGELMYRLSQNLEVDGERYERVVKTIWLDVDVSTIDALLADDNGASGARDIAAPVAPPDTSTGGAGTMSTNLVPSGGGPVGFMTASSDMAGCTWTEGSDPDRFAMVLSNLAYNPPISRLSATHEDGDRIAGALAETGFSVQRCRDTGRSEALSALREVGRRSLARKQAGAHPTTFFYYSGHGVNVEGTNYVLPVDLPGASTAEIEDGAVSFEQIFNIVSTTVASTSFIVFDACRTVMDDESRGMLRSYQPVTWSTGVFQAYATEPGKTAADDGAYSEELAGRIPAEGVPANVLFKRVQDAVARRTNEKQHPNYIDLTTGGDFYFRPE
ncbi:MAG: caspase family protein [Hyphomonas sp.]